MLEEAFAVLTQTPAGDRPRAGINSFLFSEHHFSENLPCICTNPSVCVCEDEEEVLAFLLEYGLASREPLSGKLYWSTPLPGEPRLPTSIRAPARPGLTRKTRQLAAPCA
jgi:hypothetical protein